MNYAFPGGEVSKILFMSPTYVIALPVMPLGVNDWCGLGHRHQCHPAPAHFFMRQGAVGNGLNGGGTYLGT